MDDLFAKPKPAEPKALSVTQLLRRIKNVIEVQVGELWIEGEVSNLKKQASGHWYFSLKDEGAQIQCAMFGARKRQGHDALEDGAKVRVFAEASVYEARGQLQIIVQKAERAGLGDLQARFEALKRKLHAEGLFDANRKKPIPKFPRVVGIVTSDTGAAIRDILNILTRRAPWVQPVLMPVRVQGKGAEFEIARAIERMANPERHGIPRCDVLIVGRGGGSIEDLWCFNEEVVARAIAACSIPVISAVGHEIDFTIADFVADLRAPTPSAAAELAVPDGEELTVRLALLKRRMGRQVIENLQAATRALDALKRGPLQRGGERLLREPTQRIDSLRTRLDRAVAATLDAKAARLAEARAHHRAHHPAKVLERRSERVSLLGKQLQRLVSDALESRQRKLAHVAGLLRTLGPDSAFQRGFTITLDAEGRLIRSAAALLPGDTLRTRFADGEITSVAGATALPPAADHRED
ncbi:exodeoxyribonuclease VII large subunit [Luteolibacter sp. LG18]|uniref:exodeoxyribonuclease VII large subunit n=1 Tax=Luteolibacter sp. LG18 TaxID=2819286 RepID=UPI002B2D817D|nr:exodeoxyribonuclease 7 large subunit [Luteolibacter sp. LG18]